MKRITLILNHLSSENEKNMNDIALEMLEKAKESKISKLWPNAKKFAMKAESMLMKAVAQTKRHELNQFFLMNLKSNQQIKTEALYEIA